MRVTTRKSLREYRNVLTAFYPYITGRVTRRTLHPALAPEVNEEREVLTEEAGQERQREEDRGDDRQLLVDLALTVGDR